MYIDHFEELPDVIDDENQESYITINSMDE